MFSNNDDFGTARHVVRALEGRIMFSLKSNLNGVSWRRQRFLNTDDKEVFVVCKSISRRNPVSLLAPFQRINFPHVASDLRKFKIKVSVA